MSTVTAVLINLCTTQTVFFTLICYRCTMLRIYTAISVWFTTAAGIVDGFYDTATTATGSGG